MPSPSPLIEPRTTAELVERVADLVEAYTAAPDREGWKRPPDDDPDLGWALIRVFARLAEIVTARLNRVPEKSFLAFLDLIGARLGPPQPARVPLTFFLAAGSPGDALVPAGTQVAASPLEGEKAPVLFETERDLVVTRSQLTGVLVHAPDRGLWSDCTAIATGAARGSFDPFRGDTPIEHALYLGHTAVLAAPPAKEVILTLATTGGELDKSWWRAVVWEVWNGNAWSPVTMGEAERSSGPSPVWTIKLEAVPPVPESTVAGVTGAWLRARLTTPLPHGEPKAGRIVQAGLALDAGFAASSPDPESDVILLAVDRPFRPFGDQEEPQGVFYLAAEEAFSKPEAAVTLNLDVAADPSLPAELPLTWEYWGEAEPAKGEVEAKLGWKALAVTTEGRPFLASATVHLKPPGDWLRRELATPSLAAYWLRVRLAADSFSPANGRPLVKQLSYGYSWPLPTIVSLQMSSHLSHLKKDEELTPDLGFSNQLPIDIKKDFFPFGEKPRVGDALYLASDEAFARPGATVILHIVPTNPDNPKAAPPPAEPSDDLLLEWEAWDGDEREWKSFGESSPLVIEKPWNGQDWQVSGLKVDNTHGFRDAGTVTFTCPKVAPTAIGGETRRWIRVRIARGGYGADAVYEPITLPVLTTVPSLPSVVTPISSGDIQAAARAEPESSVSAALPTSPSAVVSGETKVFRFVPATFKPPSLRSVRLGYEYTSPLSPPEKVLTVNDSRVWIQPPPSRFVRLDDLLPDPGDLGGFTSIARIGRFLPPRSSPPFEPFVPPAESRPTLYLGFARPGDAAGFANRPATLYFGVEQALYDPAAEPRAAAERAAVVWEHWDGAGWQRLATRDETRSFSRRGLVSFVGPARFPASSALGRTAFWLRARWERGDYAVRPRLRRVLTNTVWAVNARGDVAGNRSAGSVTQLKGTVPYVDGVTHYEPAAGGAPEGSLESLKAHAPKALRHRGRAVALADYEDLAFEASTEVARVQAIGAGDGSAAGTVRLIVVPHSTGSKPVPSLELLDRVGAYLEARLSPAADLRVVGPDWLRVTVEAEIVPAVLEQATDVQNAALSRLAAFLHPLTGGVDGEGWAFGRKPHRSDLFPLLESTPGVDHVRFLRVTAEAPEGEARPGRFLIFSGEHRITLAGSADDAGESVS